MERCLYFHFWGDIDSSPTQSGLIRSLVGAGIEIDLCHETRDFLLAPRLPAGVTSFRVSGWRTCRDEVQSFAARQHRRYPYSFALAVDIQGLVAALPIVKQHEIPLVYLSCELIFKDELESEEDLFLKTIEIEGTRLADLIIIQDSQRGAMLARENGVEEHIFAYLPNAPSDSQACPNANYLRRSLNISSERKIVLHTGSFDSWTCGEELLEAAHNWDERYILVVHTRHIPQDGDYASRFMNQCDPGKVLFSTTPLPFDQYGELVASCDVGLVLYKNVPTKYTQKNLLHIGLSSGKFSYFARHGKPVLASDLPCFRKIFARYHNGVCVSSPETIGRTLVEVEPEFERLGMNNRDFFLKRLDFSRNANAVIQRIQSLIRRKKQG
jgi:hypothetical protein